MELFWETCKPFDCLLHKARSPVFTLDLAVGVGILDWLPRGNFVERVFFFFFAYCNYTSSSRDVNHWLRPLFSGVEATLPRFL